MECVNYRHPDPRRGEPMVCSTQLDVFPVDPLESSRSGAELREAHLESPLSVLAHLEGKWGPILTYMPGLAYLPGLAYMFLERSNIQR